MLTLTITVVMETLPRLIVRPRTRVPLTPPGAVPVTSLGPIVASPFTGGPLRPLAPPAWVCVGVE